ncbi:hypothetical protein CP8484711_1508B, partial [Chlamydia psittaci 84-8471/1]
VVQPLTRCLHSKLRGTFLKFF